MGKLLKADPGKRARAEKVRGHLWFQGFDWDALLRKELPAPMVPNVSGDDDTSNFERYADDPEEAPMPEYLHGQDPFLNFSHDTKWKWRAETRARHRSRLAYSCLTFSLAGGHQRMDHYAATIRNLRWC